MEDDLSDKQEVGGSIPPPSTVSTAGLALGPDDVDYHYGYDRSLLGLGFETHYDVSNSPYSKSFWAELS